MARQAFHQVLEPGGVRVGLLGFAGGRQPAGAEDLHLEARRQPRHHEVDGEGRQQREQHHDAQQPADEQRRLAQRVRARDVDLVVGQGGVEAHPHAGRWRSLRPVPKARISTPAVPSLPRAFAMREVSSRTFTTAW